MPPAQRPPRTAGRVRRQWRFRSFMLYDDIQQITPARHAPRTEALTGVAGAVAPHPARRVRPGALRALF
eukprot:gene30593-52766_t